MESNSWSVKMQIGQIDFSFLINTALFSNKVCVICKLQGGVFRLRYESVCVVGEGGLGNKLLKNV